ncbi:MAG: glycosyltransferase family 4 protein [Magnetococcales bacterium]|nr:glycosyltransferase family 4 protein [Magnetococcales bacterium]
MEISLILLCTLFISYMLSRYLSDSSSILYVADKPNHRSLHTESTPRNGGIAIWLAFFSGYGTIRWLTDLTMAGEAYLWIGLALVMIISFIDDKQPLPPWLRFLIQMLATFLLLFGGFALTEINIPTFAVITFGWFGPIFSFLFTMWLINLYNFMDGMNGFAGGMGLFGFAFFALLGWLGDNHSFFLISIFLSVANLGFLPHNFPTPNAKIFMGDVGSIPMGFMVAALSLWGIKAGLFTIWSAVLIFSPFIVDATITLVRRGILGKKVWVAHHSHCYQRLVQSGWSHQKTVLYEYLLMALFGTVAVLLELYSSEAIFGVGLLACSFCYLLLAVLVYHKTTSIAWD